MGLWRRRSKHQPGRVEARVVGHTELPRETKIRKDLRDISFEPETLWVNLKGITAERVDFAGLHFVGFRAEKARFVDCDFSRVRTELLPFGDGGAIFQRCRFHGARIGDFGRVRIEECDFTDADLSGWFTFGADIVGCKFAGLVRHVVFTGSDIDGRRRNEFHQNDFRDADLDDVDFRNGIDLDAQLLPEGDAYVRLRDLPARLARTRTDVHDWHDEDERMEAIAMLDLVERVYEREPDVFTRKDFLMGLTDSPAVGARVVELLERTA
jgi:hypothetical protein